MWMLLLFFLLLYDGDFIPVDNLLKLQISTLPGPTYH